MKNMNISEFMQKDYKQYWKHENMAKNAIVPCEGLKVVERKILFAAKMLNLSTDKSTLTRKLASDTGLYHISGETSVQDTVKGMASIYKRAPEVCLLKGDGSFPTSNSNNGSAARYTSVWATPLSRQIFEDIDYCPWIVDDTGIEQVEYICMPMPIVLIRGYKGIGVGRGCYYTERNYDEVYNWSEKILDMAFPGGGSGWAKRFYDAIKDKGLTSIEDIRNFTDSSLVHDQVQQLDGIRALELPAPYNHMGARVEYNKEKHSVMFYPRIEKVTENRKTHYYITALPLESSDKIVLYNVNKKFGKDVFAKCIDCSEEGSPLKLEIPKSIAEDESLWFGLKMKRGFTESYNIWDDKLDTMRVIANLSDILLEWYRKREEVVARRLYRSMSTQQLRIRNNQLIKKYYDLREDGKIKTEDDARKFFSDDEVRYLIGLPEKTYLKENVDKLQDANKKLEKSIQETKENMMNIKKFILDEWLRVGKENRDYILDND